MLYRDQSDETLVMLTLAGEQRAYEMLVVRYEKAVVAAANSVICNRYLAEDAAQDAFITAWMKLNVLREPEKYGAWVCRIAKNCAKNMVVRFRSYLSLDVLENCISEDEHGDPEFLCVSSEEKEQLHDTIDGLPEKVRTVIHLHYFEQLSIAEIADRMRISEGTVKWQLHDGRKRIRKELGAMNEKANDTLVQRVMKKVEELKLWQLRNSKNGFEAVYRDVLSEVEKLPESTDKYHALADVLMRGWWWVPGEMNDALLGRICEAAEAGKNDDVMAFIVAREDEKLSGAAKIEFIRDKQIPRLEAKGFEKALAYEWYWLGSEYFNCGEHDKGFAAYKKVCDLLKPSDLYYALALSSIETGKTRIEKYAETSTNNFLVCAAVEELRYIDGKLRRWSGGDKWYGRLRSVDLEADCIFRNASCCDGFFTLDGMSVGEVYTGSDGTTLSFAADSVSAETAIGKIDGCQLWIVKHKDAVNKNYYKDGVGIVRQERRSDGFTEVRTLKSYRIVGGEGLVPCAEGNEWEYTAGYDPEVICHESKFVVRYDDKKTVIISYNNDMHRLKYDENSWLDMIQHIRNEYCRDENGAEKICDVSYQIERAEALAETPMEKAHTKAACSVARRILATDPEFNPDFTETGKWNFFGRSNTEKKDGKITVDRNPRWSFEWKSMGGMSNNAAQPLLYNNIYGNLQFVANCIWSDEWISGINSTIEYTLWGRKPIKTEVSVEDGGVIYTKAGSFENCIKLVLDTSGFDGGHEYIGGKKEYFFAPGVGIVRTVNYYCHNACKAVYELTSYEGTGDGYMPLGDGMVRRYDAIDLTDGYVGSAEYTYVADEDGRVVIFEDRLGIRKKMEKITRYDAIFGEEMEAQLWNEGKHGESRLRHDVNNFNILLHFMGRTNRNWAAPEKAAAWAKYRMGVIEFLAEGGDIPRAWLGHYANACFKAACAMFGYGNREEGYEYLERAFELYPRWLKIPDGELLEVGNEQIYGGIRLVKGQGLIELPDGTREPLAYEHLFNYNRDDMYVGMTMPWGWEWFDGVRGEERFKEAIERAEKLKDGKN